MYAFSSTFAGAGITTVTLHSAVFPLYVVQVITHFPMLTAEITPSLSTTATSSSDDVHVTPPVPLIFGFS